MERLNRKILPEPTGNLNIRLGYVEPQNEIETEIAELWKEVLGFKKTWS